MKGRDGVPLEVKLDVGMGAQSPLMVAAGTSGGGHCFDIGLKHGYQYNQTAH